jgi:hypothetical protein
MEQHPETTPAEAPKQQYETDKVVTINRAEFNRLADTDIGSEQWNDFITLNELKQNTAYEFRILEDDGTETDGVYSTNPEDPLTRLRDATKELRAARQAAAYEASVTASASRVNGVSIEREAEADRGPDAETEIALTAEGHPIPEDVVEEAGEIIVEETVELDAPLPGIEARDDEPSPEEIARKRFVEAMDQLVQYEAKAERMMQEVVEAATLLLQKIESDNHSHDALITLIKQFSQDEVEAMFRMTGATKQALAEVEHAYEAGAISDTEEQDAYRQSIGEINRHFDTLGNNTNGLGGMIGVLDEVVANALRGHDPREDVARIQQWLGQLGNEFSQRNHSAKDLSSKLGIG